MKAEIKEQIDALKIAVYNDSQKLQKLQEDVDAYTENAKKDGQEMAQSIGEKQAAIKALESAGE
jgi:hypothetical protein